MIFFPFFRFVRVAIAMAAWFAGISFASAQTSPLASPDLQFGDGSGIIRAIVPLADGGVLIGGEFDRVNGLVRKGVARLNADGSLDRGWNANLSLGRVNALLLQGSHVYIGGMFDEAGGLPRENLARVALADGAVSAGWQADASFLVNALATDGTYLYVGGRFSQLGGQTRNALGRVALSNGALDAWTNDITVSIFAGDVNALLVDGGHLYVGGDFDSVAGQSRAHLARVSLSSSNSPDAGWIVNASQYVTSLALFGPHVYVGGSFNQLGGVAREYLARVSTASGAVVDATWAPAAGAVFPRAILVDNAGVIVSAIRNSPDRFGIAEYDLASGAVTSWNPAGNETLVIEALAFVGGNVMAGLQNSQDRPTVLRIPRGGAIDENYRVFAGDSGGTIKAIVHAPDGRSYVGGKFRGVDGYPIMNLARINADGSLDTDWKPEPDYGFDGRVNSLALVGSDLIVGGEFHRIGGLPIRFLAKVGTGATAVVDGTWNPNPNNPVDLLAPDGGDVFVAGLFSEIFGAARYQIAKISTVGSGSATSWVSGLNDPYVTSMAVANGSLFLAGALAPAEGLLAKLSATTGVQDTGWHPAPNSGVNGIVAVGNQLFVSGQFERIGGIQQRRVAKVDQVTGAVDAAWMPQVDGVVGSIAHQDGIVYVTPVDSVNGHYTGANASAISAASGLPDFAWAPTGTAEPITLSAKSGSIWYGLPPSFGPRFGVAAYTAPACVGQSDGAICNGGPGVPNATCQASVCRPQLSATGVVASGPSLVIAGKWIELSATVSTSGPAVTGQVRFYNRQGFSIGFASVNSGVATITHEADADLSEVTAVYEGSAEHLPSRSAKITMTVLENAVRSDLGGDGLSDVLWYHSGVGGLIGMNGNGTALGPLFIIDHEPDLNWQVVGVADLDADGRVDIVWRNAATGAVYGLLMNGTAVLAEGQIYVEPNLDWRIEHVADINGDGKADLIWRNQATGMVYGMAMDGLQIQFGNVIYVEPNLDWKIVAVGDLSGDGVGDLLWRNQVTGDVFAHEMGGLSIMQGYYLYSEPNTNWKIVGVADFDGDGRAEPLWQNIATGDVFQMRLNTNMMVNGGQVIYTEPNTAWKIVALGDYNGDGRADILWQNTTTGQVYMMLMNGFAISSSAFVYTEPDTQWRILGP